MRSTLPLTPCSERSSSNHAHSIPAHHLDPDHRLVLPVLAREQPVLVGFVAASVVAILIPDSLTSLAHLLGVGRGTDLLLYVLVQVVLFQMFNTYAKDKQNQRQVVHLARRIAILEARAGARAPVQETTDC